MKFEVGKLYRCLGHYLLIYTTKEFKCHVRYSEPGEIFMVLEQDEDLLHVLFGDVAGWIDARLIKINSGVEIIPVEQSEYKVPNKI